MVSMPTCWTNTLSSVVVVLLSTMLIVACGSGGGDVSPAGSGATFALRGTITPPGFSAVDSDVNDPNAPYAANDTLEQAQEIPFPVILAGYVNMAGQGAPGRSFTIGDPKDFYRVSLSTGDPIILFIPSPNDTDLDLFLYRADDFTLVDASMGTGANETLVAPTDGEFIVEVRVIDGGQTTTGASIYDLIIGGAVNVADSTSIRLSHDFVPGEIIVRFSDENMLSSQTTLSVDKSPGFGMTHVGGEHSREMLYTFAAGEQTQSVFSALNLKPTIKNNAPATPISDALQYKIDTLQVIKTMGRRPDVRIAAPNLIRRPFVEPNDENFGLQWHYDLIHLPEAWDIITGNDEVVVAVIDTGVLFNHPDLGGRLTSDGYDFISDERNEGNEPVGERGGIDPNPDDPGDNSAGGSSFHGTHVAGTIAAQTNNALGVAGAGWNSARIMPLRVLGVGGGTSFDVLQAVRYAAGLPNDSGTVPIRPADIINLSLGSDGSSTIEQNVFNTVSASGVIVVAAAGNGAGSQRSYPAAYDGVISVSAVDFSSNLAHYSNFGDTIDIAAPGGDNTVDLNSDGFPDGVLSTIGDDTSSPIAMGYSFKQGTSMAAPHVAGVAALMKAILPTMGSNAFESLLRSGSITNDLGSPGRDNNYGFGLIDAQKAVFAARGGTIPTLLRVSPFAIGFGAALSTSTLKLDKLGDVDAILAVNSISDDADWLDVLPDQVDGNGLGIYTVGVDRTGLADGIYNGSIVFVSSANTVTVPVSMQVSQIDLTLNAGYHYVLLLDPLTFENLEQVEATLENGVYHFSFSNIDEGEYLLYAGTDLDNDFVVGDVGEALGAFLSIDQPIVIRVDQNVAGLDFRTEFNINLSDANALSHRSRGLPIQRAQKKRLKD